MSPDDRLQENIRRTTARHALKRIRTLVESENADEAYKARILRRIFRYGWLLLLFAALLFARLLGVL